MVEEAGEDADNKDDDDADADADDTADDTDNKDGNDILRRNCVGCGCRSRGGIMIDDIVADVMIF
jgi:hypothetical protein